MIHSLRLRLLATLIIVVLVAVGTVAVLTSRVTVNEFQQYVRSNLERNRRTTRVLLTHDWQRNNARDPAAASAQLAQQLGERIIQTDSEGRVLADSAGELVGQVLGCDSAVPAIIITFGQSPCLSSLDMHKLAIARDTFQKPSDILYIGVAIPDSQALSGTQIQEPGSLYTLPPPAGMVWKAHAPAQMTFPITIRRTQGPGFDAIEQGFIQAVNRTLMLAVVTAGAVVILLTLALSRRILGPVEALTAAARKMEQGDLSQRVEVQSQDEIGALAHAFNAMADGLRRLQELRHTMVTDVAHELRTPLTNIRGYLEAIRDGVAEPHPALIDSLHDEALLLNRLIDDLQELALAEAGQLRLARRPTAISEVIEKAANAMQTAAHDHGLTIGVELPPQLPLIDVDPERIGQVLRNLLTNAIAYTPGGGRVTIAARLTNGLPATRRPRDASHGALHPALDQETFVAVEVHDTGIGIAPEHLPFLFERFYRVDRSRTRATGGVGLGLAIVRQLVEAHGGQVWVTSQVGAGSTFGLMLPVHAAVAPKAAHLACYRHPSTNTEHSAPAGNSGRGSPA